MPDLSVSMCSCVTCHETAVLTVAEGDFATPDGRSQVFSDSLQVAFAGHSYIPGNPMSPQSILELTF